MITKPVLRYFHSGSSMAWHGALHCTPCRATPDPVLKNLNVEFMFRKSICAGLTPVRGRCGAGKIERDTYVRGLTGACKLWQTDRQTDTNAHISGVLGGGSHPNLVMTPSSSLVIYPGLAGTLQVLLYLKLISLSSSRGIWRCWNARKRFSGQDCATDPTGGACSAPETS